MSVELTEVLHPALARFPRARLVVVKGPDRGLEVRLQGQTVVVGSDESCELCLTDPAVSRRHVELSGGPGGYRLRDLRSTNGVFFDGVQVLEARLTDKTRFTLGRTEVGFEPERTHVQWPLSPRQHFGDVLGSSVPMRRLFAVLERAAPTDSPIILEGESGTGREALARAIHEQGLVPSGPFVVVDLAGSTEPLAASDLFGHDVSGGRTQVRPGAFEEADGGTLYLDEVAELTASLQARLLRVLETQQVKRPGARALKVQVRVIAATTQDLEAEVRAGRFSDELFLKLAVFRVRVPPLRERGDDVRLLARHFEAHQSRRSPRLDEHTLDMLSRYDWPGNVRELRNVLERLSAFPDIGSAALARGLGPDHEATAFDAPSTLDEGLLALPYHQARERLLDTFERTYLTRHLTRALGVVTHAAKTAGLPRQSFHRMLRRLGLTSNDEG